MDLWQNLSSILINFETCHMKKQINVGTALQNALNTALIECAKNKHECKDVTEHLLQCKANIEAADPWGYTALIGAASKGHSETVQLLLDRKANIEAVYEGGDTALIRAACNGHSDTVKLLLQQKANIEAINEYTALMCAAQNGQIENVKLLMMYGANVMVSADGLNVSFSYVTEFGGIISETLKLTQE